MRLLNLSQKIVDKNNLYLVIWVISSSNEGQRDFRCHNFTIKKKKIVMVKISSTNFENHVHKVTGAAIPSQSKQLIMALLRNTIRTIIVCGCNHYKIF